MSRAFLCKYYKHFEVVADPRVNRGKNHPLIEIIFLTLCATICDATSYCDVERYGKAKIRFLRTFFPFTHGIPSHDTLSRVFASLDGVQFFSCLQSWMNELAASLQGQTVALDGKTLRGSFDAADEKIPLHLVSAYACRLKLCIGLQAVDDKSNEIPAVQQLINLLELQGAVVTVDAMHCQKETVQAICDKEADYLITVKRNQEHLHSALLEALVEAFEEAPERIRSSRSVNRGHGREEVREVWACSAPDLPVFQAWKGIKTIGGILRTRTTGGQTTQESSYFITSLPCKVRAIGKHLRWHWAIENSLHWVLDVTFSEDASRIRKGTGPEISAAIRRLSLNILQRDTTIKDNVHGKRKRCGWNDDALATLLAGFSRV